MLDFGKAVILYMLLQCSKKTPTSLAEYIGWIIFYFSYPNIFQDVNWNEMAFG